MTTFVKVKRATIGQAVKSDVTGSGEWVSGEITEFDKTHITYKPFDGSDLVRVVRGEVYKADKPAKQPKPESTNPSAKTEKPVIGGYTHCPNCEIHLDNGAYSYDNYLEDVASGSNPGGAEWTREYHCLGCGEDFGPLLTEDKLVDDAKIKVAGRNYEKVVAASGRASLDNGDDVAIKLRGEPLEVAYEIAAETLELSVPELKIRYGHLNPGHQRMCLGNLLRGYFNRISSK